MEAGASGEQNDTEPKRNESTRERRKISRAFKSWYRRRRGRFRHENTGLTPPSYCATLTAVAIGAFVCLAGVSMVIVGFTVNDGSWLVISFLRYGGAVLAVIGAVVITGGLWYFCLIYSRHRGPQNKVFANQTPKHKVPGQYDGEAEEGAWSVNEWAVKQKFPRKPLPNNVGNTQGKSQVDVYGADSAVPARRLSDPGCSENNNELARTIPIRTKCTEFEDAEFTKGDNKPDPDRLTSLFQVSSAGSSRAVRTTHSNDRHRPASKVKRYANETDFESTARSDEVTSSFKSPAYSEVMGQRSGGGGRYSYSSQSMLDEVDGPDTRSRTVHVMPMPTDYHM